jgi:hypothetical protein
MAGTGGVETAGAELERLRARRLVREADGLRAGWIVSRERDEALTEPVGVAGREGVRLRDWRCIETKACQ